MSAETNGRARSRFGRIAHWLAELLLVFLGAYAAFWLSGYQQRQQDAQRRDQILASLEEYVQLVVTQSEATRRLRTSVPPSSNARWRQARCRPSNQSSGQRITTRPSSRPLSKVAV